MTTEDRVIAILRELPPDKQAEVLTFAEFLKERMPRAESPRPFGLCAGEFEVPDDFDDTRFRLASDNEGQPDYLEDSVASCRREKRV